MKREESKQTASDVLLKTVTTQETFPRTEVQQLLRSFDDGKTTVHFFKAVQSETFGFPTVCGRPAMYLTALFVNSLVTFEPCIFIASFSLAIVTSTVFNPGKPGLKIVNPNPGSGLLH